MKQQNVKLYGAMLVGLVIGSLSLVTILFKVDQSRVDTRLTMNPRQIVRPSSTQGFSRELTADKTVISPRTQDGSHNVVNFGFTPAQNGYYNLTIMENARPVDMESTSITVAGDSNKLVALNTLTTQLDSGITDYNVTERVSRDLGMTWSNPVSTNLSGYYKQYVHPCMNYTKLDLAYNDSENSYILGTLAIYHPINSTSNETLNLLFFKSFNGVNWRLMTNVTTFNGTGHGSFNYYNFDMCLSTNRSEILVLATINSYTYFIKVHGGLVQSTLVAQYVDQFLTPAIAMSPVTGAIVAVWYSDQCAFYMTSSSSNDGSTWSPWAFARTPSGNIGDPTVYWDMDKGNHDDKVFQMAFDTTTPRLDAVMIFNRTQVCTLSSTDNGSHWTSPTLLLDYPSSANVYTVDYKNLGDGNTTLAFTSALTGNSLDTSYFASSFFLRPRVEVAITNVPVISENPVSISWNGRDKGGNFARDGPYLARAWVANVSDQFYPSPSEVPITIDDTAPTTTFTVSNPWFSPFSNTSVGIKDTTTFTVNSSKAGTCDVYVNGVTRYHNESQVTTGNMINYHGAIAFDGNMRLWCVFAGYEYLERNLFLEYSDDYGKTWSAALPLVVESYADDYPSITIRGTTIYIVYMHPATTTLSAFSGWSLYLIKSTDLGKTWSTPVNITSTSDYKHTFSNPDIVVTGNGTLFVGYYNMDTKHDYGQIEVIRSSDGGTTFSTPSVVKYLAAMRYPYTVPCSLAFDEKFHALYLMSENFSVSPFLGNITAILFRSIDWGSTWSQQGSTLPGQVGCGTRNMPGLTVGVLPNSTLRAEILTGNQNSNTTTSIITVQSSDEGVSWTTAGVFLVDHVVEDSQSALMQCPSANNLHGCISPVGDIFTIYSRTPAATQSMAMFLQTWSPTYQHFHGVFTAFSTSTAFTWNGIDNWGARCVDGVYNVTAVATDLAGNTISMSQNCMIDDVAPLVTAILPPIESMNPTLPQTLAVKNDTAYFSGDYSVCLYYSFYVTGAFTRVLSSFNGTAFLQTIPATNTNEVLFYFNATDLAGNTVILGQWFYFKPTPVVVLTSALGNPDRPLDGTIKIDVQDLPASLLQDVYFKYTFNGEQNWTLLKLKIDTSTLDYVGYINGSQQYSSIDYQLFIIRVNSTILEPAGGLGTKTQVAIPPFPEYTIVYPWNLIIAIISGIFGLALGAMQTHSKRTTVKKIQGRFMNMLQMHARADHFLENLSQRNENTTSSSTKQLVRGRLMYNVMTIGTIIMIAGGLYAAVVLKNGGIGMLASALGLLLSSLALMERVSVDASDAIYLEKKRTAFFTFVHLILIVAMLLIFMISAPLVAWFNYYVIQQPYTIGPVSIPRLYISLVTPVVTSIALIMFTSYSDLKNQLIKIGKLQQSGSSWKVIWQQKEEAVSRLESNVAFKVFIFLVTIAFAVISTTQLGRYAEQGMLILAPFVIVWLVVFLIGSARMPGKDIIKEALDKWIIERTKDCPSCGATNLFENVHCTKCSHVLAGESMVVAQTVECSACQERSPAGSLYCRGCGQELVPLSKAMSN